MRFPLPACSRLLSYPVGHATVATLQLNTYGTRGFGIFSKEDLKRIAILRGMDEGSLRDSREPNGIQNHPPSVFNART